jgi:hypothetical protein
MLKNSITFNPMTEGGQKMAKTENFTAEMTAEMLADYMAVRSEDYDTRKAIVAELAARFDKKDRQIISKLSRMTVPGTDEQLYVRKEITSKVTGETPAKKIELAEKLVAMTDPKINAENVAKMNKTDIARFIAWAESVTAED